MVVRQARHSPELATPEAITALSSSSGTGGVLFPPLTRCCSSGRRRGSVEDNGKGGGALADERRRRKSGGGGVDLLLDKSFDSLKGALGSKYRRHWSCPRSRQSTAAAAADADFRGREQHSSSLSRETASRAVASYSLRPECTTRRPSTGLKHPGVVPRNVFGKEFDPLRGGGTDYSSNLPPKVERASDLQSPAVSILSYSSPADSPPCRSGNILSLFRGGSSFFGQHQQQSRFSARTPSLDSTIRAASVDTVATSGISPQQPPSSQSTLPPPFFLGLPVGSRLPQIRLNLQGSVADLHDFFEHKRGLLCGIEDINRTDCIDDFLRPVSDLLRTSIFRVLDFAGCVIPSTSGAIREAARQGQIVRHLKFISDPHRRIFAKFGAIDPVTQAPIRFLTLVGHDARILHSSTGDITAEVIALAQESFAASISTPPPDLPPSPPQTADRSCTPPITNTNTSSSIIDNNQVPHQIEMTSLAQRGGEPLPPLDPAAALSDPYELQGGSKFSSLNRNPEELLDTIMQKPSGPTESSHNHQSLLHKSEESGSSVPLPHRGYHHHHYTHETAAIAPDEDLDAAAPTMGGTRPPFAIENDDGDAASSVREATRGEGGRSEEAAGGSGGGHDALSCSSPPAAAVNSSRSSGADGTDSDSHLTPRTRKFIENRKKSSLEPEWPFDVLLPTVSKNLLCSGEFDTVLPGYSYQDVCVQFTTKLVNVEVSICREGIFHIEGYKASESASRSFFGSIYRHCQRFNIVSLHLASPAIHRFRDAENGPRRFELLLVAELFGGRNKKLPKVYCVTFEADVNGRPNLTLGSVHSLLEAYAGSSVAGNGTKMCFDDVDLYLDSCSNKESLIHYVRYLDSAANPNVPVTWLVCEKPVYASEEQLDALSELLEQVRPFGKPPQQRVTLETLYALIFAPNRDQQTCESSRLEAREVPARDRSPGERTRNRGAIQSKITWLSDYFAALLSTAASVLPREGPSFADDARLKLYLISCMGSRMIREVSSLKEMVAVTDDEGRDADNNMNAELSALEELARMATTSPPPSTTCGDLLDFGASTWLTPQDVKNAVGLTFNRSQSFLSKASASPRSPSRLIMHSKTMVPPRSHFSASDSDGDDDDGDHQRLTRARAFLKGAGATGAGQMSTSMLQQHQVEGSKASDRHRGREQGAAFATQASEPDDADLSTAEEASAHRDTAEPEAEGRAGASSTSEGEQHDSADAESLAEHKDSEEENHEHHDDDGGKLEEQQLERDSSGGSGAPVIMVSAPANSRLKSQQKQREREVQRFTDGISKSKSGGRSCLRQSDAPPKEEQQITGGGGGIRFSVAATTTESDQLQPIKTRTKHSKKGPSKPPVLPGRAAPAGKALRFCTSDPDDLSEEDGTGGIVIGKWTERHKDRVARLSLRKPTGHPLARSELREFQGKMRSKVVPAAQSSSSDYNDDDAPPPLLLSTKSGVKKQQVTQKSSERHSALSKLEKRRNVIGSSKRLSERDDPFFTSSSSQDSTIPPDFTERTSDADQVAEESETERITRPAALKVSYKKAPNSRHSRVSLEHKTQLKRAMKEKAARKGAVVIGEVQLLGDSGGEEESTDTEYRRARAARIRQRQATGFPGKAPIKKLLQSLALSSAQPGHDTESEGGQSSENAETEGSTVVSPVATQARASRAEKGKHREAGIQRPGAKPNTKRKVLNFSVTDYIDDSEADESWDETQRRLKRFARLQKRQPTGHPGAIRDPRALLRSLGAGSEVDEDEEEDGEERTGGGVPAVQQEQQQQPPSLKHSVRHSVTIHSVQQSRERTVQASRKPKGTTALRRPSSSDSAPRSEGAMLGQVGGSTRIKASGAKGCLKQTEKTRAAAAPPRIRTRPARETLMETPLTADSDSEEAPFAPRERRLSSGTKLNPRGPTGGASAGGGCSGVRFRVTRNESSTEGSSEGERDHQREMHLHSGKGGRRLSLDESQPASRLKPRMKARMHESSSAAQSVTRDHQEGVPTTMQRSKRSSMTNAHRQHQHSQQRFR